MSEKNFPILDHKKIILNFVAAFVVPTILGKVLILYFGLNYAQHPGEGYGYGLAASVLFTVFMLSRFVYKYWGYEEL